MSIMLFSNENAAFLTSGILARFPEVSLRHMKEAIACSAGFRSRRALLKSARDLANGRHFLVGMNSDVLAAKLRELGYPIASVGALETFTHADALPHRLYVVTKNRDKVHQNTWFRECQARNIPYMYIERKTRYAHLHWDCISLNSANEAHVTGRAGDNLMHLMFSNFQQVARSRPDGKAFFHGSGFAGDVENLDPKLAHQMAEMFFAMLYLPLYGQVQAA